MSSSSSSSSRFPITNNITSTTALERLQQIRSHLTPSPSQDENSLQHQHQYRHRHIEPHSCSESTISASTATAAATATTAQLATAAAGGKEDIFEDEDESKFIYEEVPPEQRIKGTYTTRNVLSRPRKFKLPNGTEIDIVFRRYVEGQDDESFQKLDSECKQGKTGLETVFFLKNRWSDFQRDTECIVATPADNPKDIIATSRGYRKWVYINGKKAPLTYHFLLRVSPRYRSSGLGEFTERILLNNDYEKGSRYILGYVVEDNEKSMALQKRILNNQDKLQTELKKWFVNGYSPKALSQKLESIQKETGSSVKGHVRHIASVREQVEHTKKAFAGAQLLPTDLSNIFRSKLSEGTYALYLDENGGGDKSKPVATFSVWNSGAIRSSKLPSMKDFLESPCVFYNCWYDPSLSQQKGVEALVHLIKTVSDEILQNKTHGFIYCFLMEDHPLAESLRQSSEFFVAWKARLWYWDASFHHDPATGCDLAFDPRDSLQ